jgi:hypothetical protein
MTVTTMVALAMAAVLSGGCASGGAVSSFRGAPFPVMLGPARVGTAPPAPGKKIDDWFGETVNRTTSVDGGDHWINTTSATEKSFMAVTAIEYIDDKHKKRSDIDMHVTSINGMAYVTSFGGAAKEYVRVDTDIVQGGPSQ